MQKRLLDSGQGLEHTSKPQYLITIAVRGQFCRRYISITYIHVIYIYNIISRFILSDVLEYIIQQIHVDKYVQILAPKWSTVDVPYIGHI